MVDLKLKYDLLEKELAESRKLVSELSSFKTQLLENEASLTSLFENTNDTIWSIDKEYRIKTLNNNFKFQFQLAFGVELNIGSPIIELLPEVLQSVWSERYSKALKGETFSVIDHFEFEGVAQFVEVRFNPIRINELVVGASIFGRDITEQEQAKKHLYEGDANQKSLIENVNARIWSIDTKFNIIIANTNFKNDYKTAFGVELEKGIFSMTNLPPEMEKQWTDRYSKALKGHKFSIVDEFQIEGVPQFTETFFNPISINKVIIGATCLSYDISEQKRAEDALKESEHKLKSLIASIPSVTFNCLADENETLTFISKEIYNLTGYKPEEFVEKKKLRYDSLIHTDDLKRVKDQIAEKLLLRQNFDLIYRIIHKSGDVLWVHERGRGNFNDQDKLISIGGTISDITKQKRAEEELFESEQRFRFLSKASVDLLSFKTKKELLTYLADSLSVQLPECIIMATSVEEYHQKLHLSSIAGIESGLLQQIQTILSKNPLNKSYSINPDVSKSLQSGKLTKHKKNIHHLLEGVVPEQAAVRIETLFPSYAVYTLGIKKEDQVVAALFILSKEPFQTTDFGFIESLANLATIVLRQLLLLEALYYSEEKLRKIFDHSKAAISIHNEKSFLLVNKAWEQLTGYTQLESKQLAPLSLVHLQERERIKEITAARLKGQEAPTNYYFPLLTKNSDQKWVDMAASLIDFEGQVATLVIANDITDRKNKEQEINKLSAAIINAPLSIVITDIDGNIEYVNPHFCNLTGYTFEEAIDNNPKVLQSGLTERAVFNELWSTILKGDVWNGEFINKKKNGEIYYESARIAPIIDENGIINNFIAIKEDITERIINLKRIENSEKELRELNAQKDKFFSIIAHDLRSPFSGLVGLTSLIKENFASLEASQVDYYLDLINQSASNVLKLLEDLLAWARTQTGRTEFKPTVLNINDYVEESMQVLQVSANSKEILMQNKAHENLKVFADRNMILTVLRNIISNAIKYTKRNGSIKIETYSKIFGSKKYVVVSVQDTGTGIPKDQLHKIFKIEENFTTLGTEKEKGTGLGLILCKEFVEMHNGKIWCESTEGVGSTFYISLPQADGSH
jgi:PAS domain S-box-containing protein